MVWISFIILSISVFAKELPKLLTKHTLDTIRFITMDGRYAYVQKRPGVLGLVSGFRSNEFLSETSQSSFLVKDSRFKKRLIIEVIPNALKDINILKNNKIFVVDWGKTQLKEIGTGQAAKLHLDDEWITFYDAYSKIITIQNILTQKKYLIKLPSNISPFYIPEVEMVSPETVVYTDRNEKGYSAFIQYNLVSKQSSILYKSPQNGTRIELCQSEGYLGVGEFPYDDIARSSKIMTIPISGSTNLAGYRTVYSSSDSDLGNMLCAEGAIYFIKALSHERKINIKVTDVVKLDLKTTQVQVKSKIGTVNQLFSMDGRILIPTRGEFYVLEGKANISSDGLRSPTPGANEELPLEL